MIFVDSSNHSTKKIVSLHVMNETTTIFHGSNVTVEKPEILIMGFYKDFGYGFYCTVFEKQAQKWALTKKGDSVVSVFQFKKNNQLKTISFPQMTEEWLDFVINCRKGIKHDYDIVEGPMADDQIWDYVEDLLDGSISREAFWVLAEFKHPTHKIVFCTPEALKTITFERSYKL